MKKSRVVLYGALLACAGVLGGFHFQQVREDKLAEEAHLKRVTLDAQRRAYAASIQIQQPSEDVALAQLMPAGYRRPASEWQASEKAFYEKLLSSAKADVLVVPFQVWNWAFDRSTRSLMAAELAAAVAQTPGVKVADPYLVAKALGDGQRRLKKEDIYRLADAVGAKRILMGYAGHDRAGKMSVAVLSHKHVGSARGAAGWQEKISRRNFANIPFNDGMPAIEVFQSWMPQIAKALDLGAGATLIPPIDSRLDMATLPASPIHLIATDDNPARDAYAFLLYHLLTPAHMERTKERFAEKALLALSRLAPGAPEYRALRARAYMGLGLRIAAITTLAVPRTDEEHGLLAALNGNLPDVRVMADREKNPLKRLLQKIDANNIAVAYGVVTQKQSLADVAALQLPGWTWQYVAARAFVGHDAWAQYDNASLKALLDHELPVQGYSLEEIARAALALGDGDKIQAAVDLSALEHGRKFVAADAAKWCCQAGFDRPGQLDYLELLQSVGHDNLIRRIRFLSAVQGHPARAISYANSMDAVYKGHPYYAMERARAEASLAVQTSGAEKEGLLQASRENAFNAFYWEQGQSLVSTGAIMQFNANGAEHFGYHRNLYYADIPFRPYYWTWAEGGRVEFINNNRAAALKNATWQIATAYEVDAAHTGHKERSVRLLASMHGRFLGSPYRNVLLSTEAFARGDTKAVEALYRENIQLFPDYWQSYSALGRQLFEEGDIAGAAAVFQSFPGFRKGASESPVGIAHRAHTAASHFYWSGHLDLAAQLHKISASQGTGAESELSSKVRLKLLAGDMRGAMEAALGLSQRYKDEGTQRDYLGILHASGRSKEAWSAFGALLRESSEPVIWETAVVGHYMAGLSEAQVVEWAKQKDFLQDAEKRNAAARHLVRFATTDRTPSANLPEAIESVDVPKWKVEGNSTLYAASELASVPTGAKPQRVKSALAYFAQGYRALKLKDYPAAKAIFDEAATFHDPVDQLFYLPYYALASVKAGDVAGIEKVLARIQSGARRFDYQLARAILAGASGNTAEALQSLDLARYRLADMHTAFRPLLTQYTYGEIAELVAELSGSPKAREIALDWARKNQKIQPWHAWTYALEARLSGDPAARQRALAMTRYLDPGSERLSAFRKAEIDSAVKAFGGANPFLAKPQEPVKKEMLRSAGRAPQPLAVGVAHSPAVGPAS